MFRMKNQKSAKHSLPLSIDSRVPISDKFEHLYVFVCMFLLTYGILNLFWKIILPDFK